NRPARQGEVRRTGGKRRDLLTPRFRRGHDEAGPEGDGGVRPHENSRVVRRRRGPMDRRTMSARDPDRLAKLLEFCDALPEAEVSGEPHRAFRVRGKTFAYYLNDHHGDGIVSLCAKATPQRQRDLVEAEPERYYVPAYLGPKGWVALRLDLPSVDWGEVVDL